MTQKNFSCDAAIFKTIEQCIKRQLFLACPASFKNNSANCTKLFDFADKCPGFPFCGGHRGHGHGKGPGNKENNSSGAQQKGKDSKNGGKPESNNKQSGKATPKAAPTTIKSAQNAQKATPPAKKATTTAKSG